MTEYEILSELLPIVSPFKIREIYKDIEKKEVHFYLEIEKTNPKPENCIKHQYYTRNGSIFLFLNIAASFIVKYLFIKTRKRQNKGS